ncbi:MAG: multiheme c-type cytochrome [Syntrophobacteraceae bacterium]
METEKREVVYRLLLWLAVIVFSVAWGVSAALAEDDDESSLQSITISGATSVNDGSRIQLRAIATLGDGTTDVTTNRRTRWSLSSTTYATISAGRVTGRNLPSCQNQSVTVTVSYSRDGVTRTDTHDVALIENECTAPTATLSSISIGGPTSLNENTAADLPVTATMSNGTTKSVTASLTENSTYASLSGVRLAAAEVPSSQSVTVSASYTEGGLTRTATKTVQILNVAQAVTLSSIAIGGPVSLNENTAADFPVTATMSDNTTKTVTASLTENSTYASLSGARLTAAEVPSSQSVTVSASYTEGGLTRTTTKTVQILNVAQAATLSSIAIGGPVSLNENTAADFPVTATMSDNTTKSVTASLTENSTYASLSGARLTAAEVPSSQSVTVSASYTEGGLTRTATKTVQILNVAQTATLSSIAIGGPASVNEGSTTAFPVTATMSNSTTKSVTATMTEDSQYAAFNSTTLTTTAVTGNQVVNVAASYTENGVTRTASKQVTIVDGATPPPPVQGSHAGRFDSYADASTCLSCHRTQAVQVYNSEHYQWSGKFGAINDFCIYPDINMIGKLTNVYGLTVDGGCLKCHPGLGAKPTKSTNPTDSDLANIDCLVCHAPNYKRTVDPVTKTKYIPDETAMGMTILEAAADIQPTTRGTCLNCHTKSGGGDNFKRGDIEEAHRNPPTRAFDVHMSSAALSGGDMHCTQCHTVSGHKISGRGVDLRVEEGTKPDCVTCHTATPPHSNSNINNYHVKRVHCTTCHIPTFAKVAQTDMFRDWGARASSIQQPACTIPRGRCKAMSPRSTNSGMGSTQYSTTSEQR